MVGRSGDPMTEINTFQDLLDLLDSNPDYIDELRVRLLTPELIALPAKFAELVATVAHISTKLDEFIATTDRRFETLEADVTTLKDGVTILKDDVKVLKDDVAALKGSDTERRARENILNIAKDELGLTRGRVLLDGSRDMDPQLRAAAEQAEVRGLVDGDAVDNLHVADIIIRARRSADARQVYAVFEVSRTINNRDIDRAYDRARSLAAITSNETIAAVIGESVQSQQRERAAERDVRVVIPAMFRTQSPGDHHG